MTQPLKTILAASAVAISLAACASASSDTTGVKSVVTDEGARQAAQEVATEKADSDQALDAAADTTTKAEPR